MSRRRDEGEDRKRPRSRARRMVFSFVRVALFAYLAWCGIAYFMQGRLLFPTSMVAVRGGAAPAGVESIWIEPEPGVRIEAWLLRPKDAAPEARLPLAVFFHGNAESIDDSIGHAEIYTRMGYAALLPEYRGYGRSGGAPSEAVIVPDVERFLKLVSQRPDIDASRLVYHGRSLGGGVACGVAARTAPDTLILESTFTSVASFAWGMGVPPLLCTNSFYNDRVVRDLNCPVLIFHGTRDTIVPPSHGRRLRDLAKHATYVEMPAGHNDFPPDFAAYEGAIRAFVRESE